MSRITVEYLKHYELTNLVIYSISHAHTTTKGLIILWFAVMGGGTY